MQNVLRATGFLGFVTGSIPCPAMEMFDSSGTSSPNPTYEEWQKTDAHLLSYVTATLSSTVYSSVLHLQTSHQVWQILEKRFTSVSRSHIHQLKNQLQTVHKKSSSMEVYLSQIKEISDQLALAGTPVDDEDLVFLTLKGLPDEYDSFKTSIRTRSEEVSMADLCSLLCSEEIHVETKLKHSSSDHLSSAYSVVKNSSFSSNNAGESSHTSSFRSNRGFTNYRGRFQSRGSRGGIFHNSHGRYNNRSHNTRGRSDYSSHGPICQICGKSGHSALDCWYRLDTTF